MMNNEELISFLRDRSSNVKTLIRRDERIEIINKFIDEREEIYLHKKSRPIWVPKRHRVTKTDVRDAEPSGFFNKLIKNWATTGLTIEIIGVYNWRPAHTYYITAARKANIPIAFRNGIYSLFLVELGHYFIKELQDRIWKQHPSVISIKYFTSHKEAAEDLTKKILIQTSAYINSMQLYFGSNNLILSVKNEMHPGKQGDKISFLQLAKILEFGTSKMPHYAHWRLLKNVFDGGESIKFMKTFLYLYLDIKRKFL